MIKVIIAGGRDYIPKVSHLLYIEEYLDRLSSVQIVSGGAKGADSFGEDIAESKGIEVKVFEADWDTHGKAAGPIRNKEMAEYADELIALWDGKSKGTKNMINEARKFKMKTMILYY